MASRCISSCVDDVARVPVRATYVNIYKWPESDLEFVRSMSSRNAAQNPRVVDSISCRQMYLRSYTFSREEDYKQDKTTSMNCLGKGREKPGPTGDGGRKKAKSVPCSSLAYIFRRLLSCTTD